MPYCLNGIPESPAFGLSGESARYEGGPLLSSVANELGNNVRPLPANMVRARQAYISRQGQGWVDVANVLVPALRPDVFPSGPQRSLTAQEASLITQVGGPVPRPITSVTPPVVPVPQGGTGQPTVLPPPIQPQVTITSPPPPNIPLSTGPGIVMQATTPGPTVPAGTVSTTAPSTAVMIPDGAPGELTGTPRALLLAGVALAGVLLFLPKKKKGRSR